MFLEVCVDTLASALNAIECGVSRLELCSSLALGGLTPTCALLQQIRQSSKIPVHCLIRPRSGDFHYDELEIQLMYKEIDNLKVAGATGFVIGCLKSDFAIDYDSTNQLIQHIGPNYQITFHRAFDIAKFDNLEETIKQLDKLGFNWLLTSGREKNVTLGKSTLTEIAKIIHKSKLKLQLLCGGGVNESFITSCLSDKKSCLKAFHGSFSVQTHCKNDIFDLGPKFETDKSRLIKILSLN